MHRLRLGTIGYVWEPWEFQEVRGIDNLALIMHILEV